MSIVHSLFKLLKIFVLVISLALPAMADDGVNISVDELPLSARSDVRNYFNCYRVSSIVSEKTYLGVNYKVAFTNGYNIHFDRYGNWTFVSCIRGNVPSHFIPTSIATYLKTNYPSAQVWEITRSNIEYSVQLSCKKLLFFSTRGNFIKEKYSTL